LRLAPWRTSPRQAYPGFQFGLGQQADGTAILQPELLAIEEQGKALVERQAGGSSIGLSFLEGGQPAGTAQIFQGLQGMDPSTSSSLRPQR
jgi:hypothetical protein